MSPSEYLHPGGRPMDPLSPAERDRRRTLIRDALNPAVAIDDPMTVLLDVADYASRCEALVESQIELISLMKQGEARERLLREALETMVEIQGGYLEQLKGELAQAPRVVALRDLEAPCDVWLDSRWRRVVAVLPWGRGVGDTFQLMLEGARPMDRVFGPASEFVVRSVA